MFLTVSKRDFSSFIEREFEEDVTQNTDWDEICMLYIRDASASFKSFVDKINFHLDEMAPFKKISRKEYKLTQKPWIANDILKQCEERDSLLGDIAKENDPVKISSLRNKFKRIRNKITKEKRDSKKLYYASYFEKNKKKSSDIWKGIRSLVNIKPTRASNIKLIEDDKLISDPTKIANIFNNHFSTIGNRVQQKIPVEQGDFNDYFKKRDSGGKLFINPDGSTFFLSPTAPGEISIIIDNLDATKSTGPNGIPVFLLKSFKDFFSIWLSKLINLSFETGTFPDILKTAKVTPLHKKKVSLCI